MDFEGYNEWQSNGELFPKSIDIDKDVSESTRGKSKSKVKNILDNEQSCPNCGDVFRDGKCYGSDECGLGWGENEDFSGGEKEVYHELGSVFQQSGEILDDSH